MGIKPSKDILKKCTSQGEIVSQDGKYCVKRCSLVQEIEEDDVSGVVCVDECQEGKTGQAFIFSGKEIKKCVYAKLTIREDQTCVDTCPKDRYFTQDSFCVLHCDSNYAIRDTKTCVTFAIQLFITMK